METTGNDRDAHVDVDDEAADRRQRGNGVHQHREVADAWSSRGIDAANHSTMPEISSAAPETTISQNNCFCPKLNRPAGGTSASSLRM